MSWLNAANLEDVLKADVTAMKASANTMSVDFIIVLSIKWMFIVFWQRSNKNRESFIWQKMPKTDINLYVLIKLISIWIQKKEER